MSYKARKVKSSLIFQLIKFIYLSLFIFYAFCGWIYFTNGLLNTILINNFIYILLPITIPIIFSFLGVYRFSYKEKNGLIEFKNSCMFLGHLNKNYRKELVIPSKKILNMNLESSFLGFKRILQVKFLGNNKTYEKRFNISLLSGNETKRFKNYLNNKSSF